MYSVLGLEMGAWGGSMGDDDAPWLRDAQSEPLQRDLEGLPLGWEDGTQWCPSPLLPGPVSHWICH